MVTSKSPYGPWSDPVDLKVGNWIDPSHVYDEGKNVRWLFMSGGHRIRLSDDGLSTIGKMEKCMMVGRFLLIGQWKERPWKDQKSRK